MATETSSESTTTPASARSTITDPVLVAFADEIGGSDEGPVAIEGNRTRWDLGGPVDKSARLVSAPVGVVDYSPAEMTVTVRAGTTVADLDAELAQSNQRCALPDRGGTVGGAVAVGEDRIDSAGTGRTRSCVLQVRYVSAEGKLVSGGGPTVNNVSGFDLPRLFTGSLGTLGCIGEVTLRTNPIPAARRWYYAPEAKVLAVRDALYRPAALLSRRSEVWVLLEGHAIDVDAQAKAALTVGDFTETEGPPTLPPHRWSMTPAQAASVDENQTGDYVA